MKKQIYNIREARRLSRNARSQKIKRLREAEKLIEERIFYRMMENVTIPSTFYDVVVMKERSYNRTRRYPIPNFFHDENYE